MLYYGQHCYGREDMDVDVGMDGYWLLMEMGMAMLRLNVEVMWMRLIYGQWVFVLDES